MASIRLSQPRHAVTGGWPAESGHLDCTHLLPAARSSASEKDRDRYGRIVAICRASEEDLGAILLREGFAWAFDLEQTELASLGAERTPCESPSSSVAPTGLNVPGYSEKEQPPDGQRCYEGVHCLGCQSFHIFNPETGRLLVEESRRPSSN
jgi:hypothetical protein